METRVTFEKFGSYVLLDRLACGGMAAVYLARPANVSANGRILVVKRILPQVANDPTFLNMFKSETRVCMGFNHPNIVQIFDFGQVDEQPYIAMEYIEGKNLRQLINQFAKSSGTIPIPVALSIGAQAAAALHHAHTFKNRVTGEALNIIHRDVSPQNILISYDGNVKVIDFGIAKALVEDAEHTRTATIKGKISYLSPEQVRREPLDCRSDIFSLGAVLWELLTGQKLFALLGRDDFEIMEKIRKCEGLIEPPSKYNPAVPSSLDEIVLTALKEQRVERYQNAEIFQKTLRDYLMTNFPGFAYRDVAQTMRTTFSSEIANEQGHLRGLNDYVQRMLEQEQESFRTPAPEATAVIPQIHHWPQGDPGFRSQTPPAFHAAPRSGGSGPIPVPATPKVRTGGQDYSTGSYSYATPSQGSVVLTGQFSNAPGSMPRRVPRFPQITRLRVLVAVLYVLTIYFLKMDRDYMFFERFFIPAEYVRMAMKAPKPDSDPQSSSHELPGGQPAQAPANGAEEERLDDSYDTRSSTPSLQQRQARARSAARRLSAPIAAASRSVMLRISVEPRSPGAPTRVFINDVPVKSLDAPIKVPVDQTITVRVERPSFQPYKNQFVLSAAQAASNPVFKLDVKLTNRR